MTTFAVLFCVTLFWMSGAQQTINRPVYTAGQPVAQVLTPPVLPTLKQDFRELERVLPTKEIRHLVRRYLLNDAEFQAVIRTINSYDAFSAIRRLRSQPEIIGFLVWLRNQIRLSGGDSSEEDSDELHIFNKSPYWAGSVNGWQGFVNEFSMLLPNPTVVNFIEAKVRQGGSFAEFKNRLGDLEVVFDRFILFPETQRVIAQLQSKGVDIKQLDNLIRFHLGWTTVLLTTTTGVKPVSN